MHLESVGAIADLERLHPARRSSEEHDCAVGQFGDVILMPLGRRDSIARCLQLRGERIGEPRLSQLDKDKADLRDRAELNASAESGCEQLAAEAEAEDGDIPRHGIGDKGPHISEPRSSGIVVRIRGTSENEDSADSGRNQARH